MVDNEKPEESRFDEVMLAMDVVDTLRHEQQVVERELASDEQDRAMFDKLKRMYASQGLEVTDEIIAAGVAALREERFAYRPPPPKGSLWLARLYVNRGRWAKAIIGVVIALTAVILVYRFAFVAPEANRREKDAKEFNSRISRQHDLLTVAGQRLENLNRSLKAAADGASRSSEAAAGRLLSDARSQLAEAGAKLQAIEKLPIKPSPSVEDFVREGPAGLSRLEQRTALLNAANVHLDKAEAAMADMSAVAALRGKLAEQRRRLLEESMEDAVRVQTERLYADALAALNTGDAREAGKGSAALQELYGRVTQEYELRIVSRPGAPSGVWREPPNRPGVRNYYVIVEAVTPKGERLTLPITGEEDGTTRNVSQWGLRVDGALFEKIRRDKSDDGIIQDNRFGFKERGHLAPRYLMPTTGGAITQW